MDIKLTMNSTSSEMLDEAIKQDIIDYWMQNKICVKRIAVPSSENLSTNIEENKVIYEDAHVPLAVLPSPYSKASFEKLTENQIYMNKMVHNLMCNIPRVRELLKDLGSKDEFVGGLLRISKLVEQSEHKQKGYLAVLRMDYMFDKDLKEPKMVEFNTIASSFGPLSYGVNWLHRYLVEKYGVDIIMENLERKKNPKILIAESLKQAYNLYFDSDINGNQ